MEVQLRIIFLLMEIILSATEDVKKNLMGTEGGSFTLPDPVLEIGFVSFGANIIAMLNERKIQIWEDIYKDKVLWNKNTGLFTITGLQRNDSGIYHINSKKGMIFATSYILTVYEPVPAPAVHPLSVSPEGCTLQCFVEKADETTLLWYKEDEIVNQSSSALALPLTVHRQEFNALYRCVAANPAENKTLPVNVTKSCSGQNDSDSKSNTDTRHHKIGIAIFIVSTIVVILVSYTVKWSHDKNKRTRRQTQDSVSREPDVQYTDMHISEDKGSEEEHLPDSSGPVDISILTTVYDKVEAYRMMPDTAT